MLGNRLKEVRNHLKLSSAKKLSDLIGVPEYIIKDLESGKTQTIKPELATHIEDLCKISGWWLLTGRGKMLLVSSENKVFLKDYFYANSFAGDFIKISTLVGTIPTFSILHIKHIKGFKIEGYCGQFESNQPKSFYISILLENNNKEVLWGINKLMVIDEAEELLLMLCEFLDKRKGQ